MSNIYALEPHTNAKVILHTTSGDIEIELWGKEAPRATRNFIQLCLEGYYDNTIFHRIIPDFLVQGGDPTGTGQGGESIYEDGFPDEFHSRLRFNRRGLVGLANTGQDDNGSQFFITLDRADELTKKHTLFGRVAGDTLFNVMKMTELELDENERPLYPPRIKSAEVVLNPFDDIIPRITAEEKRKAKQLEKKKLEEAEAKKKKKGGKKQLNLLSFGEEAAEFEPEPSTTIKPKTKKSTEKKTEEKKPAEKKKTLDERLKEKIKQSEGKKSEAIDKIKQEIRNISKQEQPPAVEQPPVAMEIEPEPTPVPVEEPKKEPEAPVEKKKEKKKSLVALEREKYVKQQKKTKKGSKKDDSDVFNQLMAFQKKLSSAKETAPEVKKEQKICQLHDIPNCESCFADVGEDDVTDEGWISHKLVFDKDLKGKDLMQRKETVDDYVVIDPRDREAKLKQEEYERKRSQKTNPAFKRERDDRDDYRRRDRRRDDGRRRDDDWRRDSRHSEKRSRYDDKR